MSRLGKIALAALMPVLFAGCVSSPAELYAMRNARDEYLRKAQLLDTEIQRLEQAYGVYFAPNYDPEGKAPLRPNYTTEPTKPMEPLFPSAYAPPEPF
jgi:hypothetical protein